MTCPTIGDKASVPSYYVVNAKGYSDEYSAIIKAESPSKAKKVYYWRNVEGLDECGIRYIDLRAKKIKELI